MAFILDFLGAGQVICFEEIALLAQDFRKACRVLQDIVGDGLQRWHEVLLARGFKLGRIPLGEEKVGNQLLVL